MRQLIVVLAVDRGKGFRSDLPVFLHRLGGRPLVAHVLKTVQALQDAAPVVIVQTPDEAIRQAVGKDVPLFERRAPQNTLGALRQIEESQTDRCIQYPSIGRLKGPLARLDLGVVD